MTTVESSPTVSGGIFLSRQQKNQLQGRRYQDENEAIFFKDFLISLFFKKIVDIYGPRFLATTKGLTR
jgi:hypothetical protein